MSTATRTCPSEATAATDLDARARAIANHPSGAGLVGLGHAHRLAADTPEQPAGEASTVGSEPEPLMVDADEQASRLAGMMVRLADEAGSVIAEYGLLIILGVTIATLAIKWATGGAIFDLFGAIMSKVRAVAGL